MSKVYFIEKRIYTLDKNEPIGSDYKSIWGFKAYASYDLASKDLQAIKNIRHLKYGYNAEIEDMSVYYGERKWKHLNIREEFQIIGLEVEGASNE